MNTWYLITFDCPCNLKTISSSSQYRYRTPLQSACVISLQCHVKSSFIKMQQRCVSFGKTVQNLAEKPWFQSCLTLVLMSGCYYSFPKTVIGLFTSLIGLMFQISKIFTRVWRLLREKMHSIIDQFGQLQDWVSTHSNWISLPTSIIRVHFFQKKWDFPGFCWVAWVPLLPLLVPPAVLEATTVSTRRTLLSNFHHQLFHDLQILVRLCSPT